MDWNYSAPSCNNYFICQVTTCLWVLQHKHHSQFGNVLCWHSQKNGFIYQEVSFLNFVLSHLNSSFFTPVLPLKLLATSWISSPLSLFALCGSDSIQMVSSWSEPVLEKASPEDEADLKRLCTAQKVIFLSLALRSYPALHCKYVCMCGARVQFVHVEIHTHTHL